MRRWDYGTPSSFSSQDVDGKHGAVCGWMILYCNSLVVSQRRLPRRRIYSAKALIRKSLKMSHVLPNRALPRHLLCYVQAIQAKPNSIQRKSEPRCLWQLPRQKEFFSDKNRSARWGELKEVMKESECRDSGHCQSLSRPRSMESIRSAN